MLFTEERTYRKDGTLHIILRESEIIKTYYSYHLNGRIKSEIYYRDHISHSRHGYCKWKTETGEWKGNEYYVNGMTEGECIGYDRKSFSL